MTHPVTPDPGPLGEGGASPTLRPRPAPPRGAAGAGCETGGMPVLDPNPQNGQRKLLYVLGAMLAITVVIGVIATIASP
ncbi:hypothetical protein GCM10010400_28260 [Streptomyces aculeolatus]